LKFKEFYRIVKQNIRQYNTKIIQLLLLTNAKASMKLGASYSIISLKHL